MIKRHYKRIITLYEVPGAIEVREMAKTVMTGVTITCDVCGCNIDKDYYRIFTCDCGDCQWEDDELDDELERLLKEKQERRRRKSHDFEM